MLLVDEIRYKHIFLQMYFSGVSIHLNHIP